MNNHYKNFIKEKELYTIKNSIYLIDLQDKNQIHLYIMNIQKEE